jgi:hypothetical protein
LISVFCGAKFTDLTRTPWIVRVGFEKAVVGKGKKWAWPDSQLQI